MSGIGQYKLELRIKVHLLTKKTVSLSSYGGTLEWTYKYSSRYSSPTVSDDVIISDGQDQVFYRFGSTGPSRRENKRTLQLTENNWRDGLNRPVSRSKFLNILKNFDSLRIRAVYDKTMHETAIGRISLESGETESNF